MRLPFRLVDAPASGFAGRVIETKAGVARYDGKMLANVPKIRDLPSEVS